MDIDSDSSAGILSPRKSTRKSGRSAGVASTPTSASKRTTTKRRRQEEKQETIAEEEGEHDKDVQQQHDTAIDEKEAHPAALDTADADGTATAENGKGTASGSRFTSPRGRYYGQHDTSFASSSSSSSIRVSRLAEKQELGDLNRRLEMYILKVREKDANKEGFGREIELLKDRYQSDMETSKKIYESQIEQLKKQRADTIQQLTKIQHEYNEIAGDTQRVQDEIQTLTQQRDELQQDNKALIGNVDQVTNELRIAEDDRSRLTSEIDLLNGQVEKLQQQASAAQKLASDATSQLGELEGKIAALEADLASTVTTKDKEIEQLTARNDVLLHSSMELEETLRREFGRQLKGILEARQKQFEEEKEELIHELRETYMVQIDERERSVELLTQEVADQQEQIRLLQERVSNVENEASESISIKLALEQRVAMLQQQLAEEKKRVNEEVAVRQEQQRLYLQTVKRKDEDFQTLMDVKVALDNEIKQYRQLLENEEYRIAATPEREDVVADEDFAAPVEQSAEVLAAAQHLRIVEISKRKKELTLQNPTDTDVPLAGFSLYVAESGAEFKFPSNVLLPAGAELKISTKHAGSDTLLWNVDDEDVFTKGYVLAVKDPHDIAVNEVTL